MGLTFFVNSIFLGIGLAMDAFSVSMANGLGEPRMSRRKIAAIAATFAGFQFLMPLIGWGCVHAAVQYFTAFQPAIPWIALALLGWIGGTMLVEGIRNKVPEEGTARLGVRTLLLQGVATSIDALSVGFAIADYDAASALVCVLVIMAVTFVICVAGVLIGRAFGTRLAGKASILGGAILIAIGLEIFISDIFF